MRGFGEKKICIHKDGRVYAFIDGKYILKNQFLPSHKYPAVSFRRPKLVHRLVARGYAPNPDNKREVNHKNGVRGDCRASNLEWVTPSENIRHSYKELGRKSNINTGKGSVYWDRHGNIWRAKVTRDRKDMVKSSKDKSVCERWLGEKINGL